MTEPPIDTGTAAGEALLAMLGKQAGSHADPPGPAPALPPGLA